ncbi:erythroblast NAD(P)(+)--arginine ADP-ribosyltransferase-like [Micropterus salmoides]|uniref:erythroblast NAD(P)(+)--arginine ADP-ribosyltransferase-like n=1 Tax=Micropterus salmoides TaxID=27706 RepID=UPI0018EC9AAA|nr:erythroblast NAD(P)(+)--arginine ADP-ribosyltransferase-like [Micropterus salmoides]
MKGNMMVFASLLLCWMLPVDSMTIRYNLILRDAQDMPWSKTIKLSMAEDSVDDMYFDCNNEMAQKVNNTYFEEEKSMALFGQAWKDAETCSEDRLKKREKEDKALTKDHMQAICVYTADKVYKEFNVVVRKERSKYSSSSFQFHSLHFLLTSAIKILNRNFHCHTTYRRTRDKFTGKVNQIIRFGSFTSSSYRTDLKLFGDKTCFKIKTCLGAFLKNYSRYVEEKEVLIPPYEMFKITKTFKGKGKIQGLEDCKTVYEMESAGCKSNLNCKAAYP